ncbi:MAG: ribokinase [Chloroflexi bacterium]|nr:ribokinase [Chloroflexota bacterium]
MVGLFGFYLAWADKLLEFCLMTAIDYLLIGHITRDVMSDGYMPGGTVTYSGRVAAALGCHTAVLTSAAANEEGLAILDGLEWVNIPAAHTTTFENVYTADGRIQTIHTIAEPLTVNHLPDDWQHPGIVHLAPIINEVDVNFVYQLPDALIGLTPQGWLRDWGDDGRITPGKWKAAADILPLADVVILSPEDLPNTATLWQYWELCKLLILTAGPHGCIVIQGEGATRVPGIPVEEVDPTGAGDIFATAYLIRYHQTGDPLDAAHFANAVAAHSVGTVGIDIEGIQSLVKNYE